MGQQGKGVFVAAAEQRAAPVAAVSLEERVAALEERVAVLEAAGRK